MRGRPTERNRFTRCVPPVASSAGASVRPPTAASAIWPAAVVATPNGRIQAISYNRKRRCLPIPDTAMTSRMNNILLQPQGEIR